MKAPTSSRPYRRALTAATALALTVSVVGSGVSQGVTPGSAATSTTPVAAAAPAATTALPATLAKDVRFSREEERLARDLYAALAKVHDGARPMSRITLSEQRHYDAVGTLITRFGLTDPSAGRAPGSYAFPELQRLYDDWLSRGKASLKGAYAVGVELEKRDIADLERIVAATTQPDADRVFSHLLTGSRMHLSAFERAAAGGMPGQGPGQRQGSRQGRARRQGKGPGQGCQALAACPTTPQGAGQRGGRMGAGSGSCMAT